MTARLLHFLPFTLLIGRFTPQPNPHKGHPRYDCNPNASNPHPTGTDLPTAWILVMCKMSYCHFSLDIHIGEEWSLVVDAEGENAMLVWQSEGRAKDRAICSLGHWNEVEPVEWREHGEFELDSICRVNLQRCQTVVYIF